MAYVCPINKSNSRDDGQIKPLAAQSISQLTTASNPHHILRTLPQKTHFLLHHWLPQVIQLVGHPPPSATSGVHPKSVHPPSYEKMRRFSRKWRHNGVRFAKRNQGVAAEMGILCLLEYKRGIAGNVLLCTSFGSFLTFLFSFWCKGHLKCWYSTSGTDHSIILGLHYLKILLPRQIGPQLKTVAVYH